MTRIKSALLWYLTENSIPDWFQHAQRSQSHYERQLERLTGKLGYLNEDQKVSLRTHVKNFEEGSFGVYRFLIALGAFVASFFPATIVAVFIPRIGGLTFVVSWLLIWLAFIKIGYDQSRSKKA